jgi:hypothetical protein
MLDELKISIEETKEELEDQLSQVGQAISGAGAALRDLLLADQAHLQICLDSLAQAQRVADTTQPQVVIERNRGGEESRTLFGTDTSRPEFCLTVSNNEAQRGAIMAAGVHSPETLQALLNGTPAADLVLALQALQTGSPNINKNILQSFLNNHPASHTQGTIDRSSTSNVPFRERISAQEDTPEDTPDDCETLPSRPVHRDDGSYNQAL